MPRLTTKLALGTKNKTDNGKKVVKRLKSLALSSVLITTVAGLAACGNRAKMETCKLVEIEDAEFEVEFGDVDAEGGEVEMVCGDKIVDIPWKEFRQKLRIDPGKYKNNPEAFKQQVTCLREDSSRKQEVFCQGPGAANEFAALKFNYDD